MHLNETSRARLSLLLAMVIWGSIGLFRRYIPLPSGLIAEVRALVGVLFLLLLAFARKSRPSLTDMRKNALPLLLSGVFIGFNWILLFEAYNYASVATATLCYYMAPMIVMVVSPFMLKERLTPRKFACLAVALIGMALVSGVFGSSAGGTDSLRGVLLGLAAAVLYAGVILTNKRICGVSAMDRTIAQLGVSAIVLLPYTLFTEDLSGVSLTAVSASMLLIIGIIHTGLAYALYFGSMKPLRAQSVALMSYIDPVVAILLSALILKEPLSPASAAGAVLVLGAACISELPEKNPQKADH